MNADTDHENRHSIFHFHGCHRMKERRFLLEIEEASSDEEYLCTMWNRSEHLRLERRTELCELENEKDDLEEELHVHLIDRIGIDLDVGGAACRLALHRLDAIHRHAECLSDLKQLDTQTDFLYVEWSHANSCHQQMRDFSDDFYTRLTKKEEYEEYASNVRAHHTDADAEAMLRDRRQLIEKEQSDALALFGRRRGEMMGYTRIPHSTLKSLTLADVHRTQPRE